MLHSMADHPILPAIERGLWLPAEPAAIWERLTDGKFLSTWFDAEVTIEPRPGGRIELTLDHGEVQWGTVEVVEAGRSLQWTWRTDDGEPSLVRIELASSDGGTRLTVTETLLEYEMTFHPQVDGTLDSWIPRVEIG